MILTFLMEMREKNSKNVKMKIILTFSHLIAIEKIRILS